MSQSERFEDLQTSKMFQGNKELFLDMSKCKMYESNISLKIIKIFYFWRKMIFGYGLYCSSHRQAVMVLSSKRRLTRLRAKHDAVSHFWGTNKKLK